MYAIVKVGGKQYRVESGDSLVVDRMSANEGDKVELVPLLFRPDGDEGTVFAGGDLEKVKIEATVTGHERGKKVRVLKYKPKRGYRRRSGARADLTRLAIGEIKQSGRRQAAKQPEAKAAEAPPAAQSSAAEAATTEAKPAAKKAPEKKPAAKKPADAKPAAKKPAAKKPTAKKPAAKKPAAKKPAAKKPAAKKPAAKKPAAKSTTKKES
jgi:large subunit ribosomal protein L21